MTYTSYAQPDPHSQPEFYADTPVKRLIAWLIDTVLVMLLALLAVPFTAFTAIFFFPLFFFVVGFAYRVVSLANGSATIGMRLAAIELRDRDGQRFGLQQAALHTLGYTVSMAFPVLQVISIVLMLTTARAQGLSDHVLGSVMINRAARF